MVMQPKRARAILPPSRASGAIALLRGHQTHPSERRRGGVQASHMGDGGSDRVWAEHYIRTTSLRDKLTAPPAGLWCGEESIAAPVAPGRPARLKVAAVGLPTPKLKALQAADKRAQLVHTFWHHELQAAELMCWALLAYRDTPRSFRRGLVAICADEIRHMHMYNAYLEQLGFGVGDFPVRDWFWLRLPACKTPLSYVATMGVGFEGGNLDHTARFAARFRRVGDVAGASLQEQIGSEEVAHVRFAWHWYQRWSGNASFDHWRSQLPAPLSPLLMRGRPLAREARRAAGFSGDFIDALAGWKMDMPRAGETET